MEASLRKVIGNTNYLILNSPPPPRIPKLTYFLMKPMLRIFQKTIKFEY